MTSSDFPAPQLDLSQVKCPLNFVKAKLALEKRPPGSELLIRLSGDLTMNVPQSLRQEGHTVELLQASDEGLLIRVIRQG